MCYDSLMTCLRSGLGLHFISTLISSYKQRADLNVFTYLLLLIVEGLCVSLKYTMLTVTVRLGLKYYIPVGYLYGLFVTI